MTAFLALHALAENRGDGLPPKLLALMETRARITDGTVAELARRRAEPHIQAGPHPVGVVAEELPEGMVRFRRNNQSSRAMPLRAAES